MRSTFRIRTSSHPVPQRPTFRAYSGQLANRQPPAHSSRRLSLKATREIAIEVATVAELLPRLCGRSICIVTKPELTAHRGELFSRTGVGRAVHAASFIRKRQIVLGSELADDPALLRFMLIHEIFHFVWAKLGNKRRRDYAALLEFELERGARGELGESSEFWKTGPRSAGWKNYVSESFCDTAAWILAPPYEQPTLAARWRTRRKAWFGDTLDTGTREKPDSSRDYLLRSGGRSLFV